MEKVLGFGGFFFKARDPKAIAQWYEDNLGVAKTPGWEPQGGPTAFQPFSLETKMFPNSSYMLNFRVSDLHAMAEQLRMAGTEVKIDPETYPMGIFGTFSDPEGNEVQLWEPREG